MVVSAMKTTIDAAGRIIVPKAVREALRLTAGQQLDIVVADGTIEIHIPITPMALVETASGPVAATDVPLPVLTTDVVRDVLESVRR
jgi:AbrB family looped-hinge helix DNA binding protein